MQKQSLGFRRKVLWTVPRDSLADVAEHFQVKVSDGRAIKAHVFALARSAVDLKDMLGRLSREELQDTCHSLDLNSGGKEKARLIERILASETVADTPQPAVTPAPTAAPPAKKQVFIGHGGSPIWRELKDFLKDELGLDWDEFNRESTAGRATVHRLEQMLSEAVFAFLVLTAEDEHSDGKLHARENVIHEAGLFQGKLGFHRAIVLLEEGCTEFSNIAGLTEIRFPRGNVMAKSEEIRRVLRREQLIGQTP
jgi:predicted nucleotide-binding protein